MAEITLSIESAPIALTLSAAQGPAGANGINGADGADGADGATTWAELTDKTTAPIATENTSVSTALAAKAPLSGASLENAEFYGSTTFSSDSFTYNPGTSADAHREALGLSSSGTAEFNNLTASGTVTGGAATFASMTASGTVNAASLQFSGVTSISRFSNQMHLHASGVHKVRVDDSNLGLISNYGIAWTNITSTPSGGKVSSLSQSSSGVLQIGTGQNNASGSLLLTNLTASGTVTAKQYVEGFVDLGTVGMYATIVITGGTHVRATLSPATPCTFLLPDPAEGLSFILAVRQATVSTTSATFYSFVGGVVWPGGVEPVMTPSPDRVDIFSFVAGRNLAGTGWLWHGSAIQDFTLT